MRTHARSLTLLAVFLGATAAWAAVPPTTTYYFINPDSAVLEVVVSQDSPAPVMEAAWMSTTPAALHAMGINTPSENIEVARQKGMYWEEEHDGTKEARWYVLGQGSGNGKFVLTGARSTRVWTWPGRVEAKTTMYRDGEFVISVDVTNDMTWQVTAQTPRYWWYDGSVHTWLNKTEHWYGGARIYGQAPAVSW